MMTKFKTYLALSAIALGSSFQAFADTAAFTITEDASLSGAIADARSEFLAMRSQNQPAFNRLDVAVAFA